jgi:hypothetical protein
LRAGSKGAVAISTLMCPVDIHSRHEICGWGLGQAWDMSTGKCVQTIPRAHDTVIMGMLSWEVRSLNCLFASFCATELIMRDKGF